MEERIPVVVYKEAPKLDHSHCSTVFRHIVRKGNPTVASIFLHVHTETSREPIVSHLWPFSASRERGLDPCRNRCTIPTI